MDGFNLTDAEKSLSELVDRAEAGETIYILRDGKLVAKLVPAEQAVETPKRRVDIEALRQHLDRQSGPVVASGEVVRTMRDEARY
ncbi:type II toxin-antitoxin system Phd/YefM family antitoxin [Blastomonas sp.]|jgi:antitoxin (DNA-binding transcriptional repressor) of toxin-antitoxin stability system|uniref:type II toxin-antitoxin system Phd/YefM family antitoxin n=1 Tax=Blastomonas TaxID=150203 RepID=UPI00258F4E05|nr:type II toxin-antitoxin system Phd/YefM family antitoxin [Blastomonas sp.]